jgi:hypothetical protein
VAIPTAVDAIERNIETKRKFQITLLKVLFKGENKKRGIKNKGIEQM